MVNFKIISFNVGRNKSLPGLKNFLNSNSVDICFLQETTFSLVELESFIMGWGFECAVNYNGKFGLALLWRSFLPVMGVTNIVEGRAIVASFGDFTLLNIYAPAGSNNKAEREGFFGRELFRLFRSKPLDSFIFGGDFNCVLQKGDIKGGVGFSYKKSNALRDLVIHGDLQDSLRVLDQQSKIFTFFRPGMASSRLDRFYLSNNLVGGLRGIKHSPSLSDHCIVLIEIELDLDASRPRRKLHNTYWKLNSSILKDLDFSSSFSKFWKDCVDVKDDFGGVDLWWDLCAKPGIREFCRGYSIVRQRNRRRKRGLLFEGLGRSLYNQVWDEVARIRNEIKLMEMYDAYGVLVRSRFKQNAEFEQGSLFHQAREFKNIKNNLDKLKIGGAEVEDKGVIEEEVLGFFGALFNGKHDSNLKVSDRVFTPDNSGLDELFEGLGFLSDEDRDALTLPFVIEDLENAVKGSQNNKSPGLDGISYEFYKETFQLVGVHLLEAINAQLEGLNLVMSNRRGVTRLLSKVKGVPGVDELRPITLLNADYKLLTKMIVARLLPLLEKVIKSSQLCSVGGKNILFGAANIISSIEFINKFKLKGFLFSLDFFKAYDRVFIPFVILILKKMNFGDVFASWVQMLHEGARTRFILGFLTGEIEVSFSIRQGDPLAMLLYIIYVEPLLLLIERKISGLHFFRGLTQKVEAYCDDIQVVSNNIDDLVVIDRLVLSFEKASGALLSRSDKCKLMGLGGWKDREFWPLAYPKVVSEIKVFGVFMLSSFQAMMKRNWDFRFTKFRDAVFSWSSRVMLSLSQRVEVLRVFALSRIWYLAALFPIRDCMIKKFESIMGGFVWGGVGRIFRVSLVELKNPCLRGGLGLVCIRSMADSLRLMQLLRLLKSSDGKSICHFNWWIGDFLSVLDESLGGVCEGGEINFFFVSLVDLVLEALDEGWLSQGNWRLVSNRYLYKKHVDKFKIVRVEQLASFSFNFVWGRVNNIILERRVSDLLFLIIHNKLAVKERFFRVGLIDDPYCDFCQEAVFADILHFFTGCVRVSREFAWVRGRIVDLLGVGGVSNFEILNLIFPKTVNEDEIIWLLGSYVEGVWTRLFEKGESWLRFEEFFGYLTYKYREANQGFRKRIVIPALL